MKTLPLTRKCEKQPTILFLLCVSLLMGSVSAFSVVNRCVSQLRHEPLRYQSKAWIQPGTPCNTPSWLQLKQLNNVVTRMPSRIVLLSESSSEAEDGSQLESTKVIEGEIDESIGDVQTHSKKQRPSTARVGGRTTPSPAPSNLSNENGGNWMTKILLPALAILLLLKLLFGGLFSNDGGSDPSFVYYQRSVYQSRSLKPDGRVETSRKTSVRSNIPSLVKQGRKQNKNQNDQFLLQQSPDEDFDEELEDMMRFQKSMLQDFFF